MKVPVHLGPVSIRTNCCSTAWAPARRASVSLACPTANQRSAMAPVGMVAAVSMNTSWNRLNNDGEFARAKYLGRLIKNDIVHLEMNLTESRFLFDTAYDKDTGIKNYHPLYNSAQEEIGREWYKFDYTFQPPDEAPQGIPSPFSHYVEGGFNSLKVSIDESKNAQSYEISFREKGNTSLEWKRINIRADMLTYNNNEVYINRHTRDINGNEIGFINGSLLSQGGLTYEVRARSRGLINDVELYTNSMTNGMIDAEAVVYNVDVTTNPGSDSGFTFSAAGMEDNQIYVRIGNASYTEYYKIICHGPYNYPKGDVQPPLNDDTAPVLPAIYGHPGLNKIKIANPANADKPGIYKIEVYAVNNNAERPANNEVIPVVVIHDKYAPHRDKAFAPRLSEALFDKRAIDLEVNFNDGTGWYRLKLASTDKGDKRIDCRHTSYYEYDKQKFHIFFKAPSGSQDEYSQKYAEGHDVFGGGREEAELYIRTVAEQRYRDTFWMKKQFGDDSFTENLNFIITNSGIQDFITYWSAIDISDASNIDSALVSYGVQNNGTYSEGIELKGNNISNYFFSPLEMRKYDVKVNLDEQLPSRFIYELDAPTFKTVAGDRSININEFDSMYADWYEIHYKEILDMNAPVVGLNENPLLWPLYGDVYQNNNQEYVTTLENLLPNRNYALIVVGKNGDGVVGTSKPVYYDGLKGTTKYTDAEKIWVYEATPPSVSPSIGSVSMKSDNHRMIQVDNVSYPGEVRYQIWWKRNSEPWSQASYYDTYTDNKKLEYGPVSYTITNHRGKSLEYWETYDVMARAGTIGDNWGPFSAAQSVTIGNTGGFDIGDFYWGGAFQVNTGYWFWYYPLYLNWITVPEGTVSYRITGYITEQGGTAWWAGTIYPYYIYIDQTLTPGTTWIHLGNVFSTAGGFLTDHTTTWVSVYFTITTYNDTGDTLSQSYYVDTGQGTLPWFQ